MKNIVLMTTKYNDNKKDAWLTNELAYSIRDSGHNMTVVVFSWMPNDPETSVSNIDGVQVVRLKLPKWIYKKNIINTALKIFAFPFMARSFIKKNVKECDLLIANTPCVTILGLSGLFKRRYNAYTYLVLWDFFPFYLKDLGLMRNKFNFKFFHFLEEWMYRSFDKIGCMTKGNEDFLKNNFKTIKKENIEILPLWAKTKKLKEIDRQAVRSKFNLPCDDVIIIYGGAMSVVQELENYLELAKKFQGGNVSFIMVGTGTEKEKLKEIAEKDEIKNLTFIDYVPRDEYEELVGSCDIGFISLSRKLTVPSFPSKSLDYFKVAIPILASLDPITDFGDILENRIGAGYSVVAGNLDELESKATLLINDSDLRENMGKAGRKYYEEFLTVENAKNIIMSKI
ncbi:TPA: glycosyltransferase family 4 protein [Citrobacter freundii]|uniref:Glycosyltransferase family 4 protein n=3 Tax=Citrobacter farmeri TaxID=67824 RepID=A0A8H9P1U7_9ENTR|nr:glycosyltransferase family 4 protein [Citrobacter farmeri]HAT2166395.1 glycosyltransferase family 4 protein [Citrobacter freundii]AST80552.1 glycosyltransferase WbuB [Citrobacter farmeri]ELR9634645.1 glycosyltransferase family 4 protein [Citrobacter farmeri]EMB4690605.1 glycosyltransferase family 4 protein [Citrobacter farmeri]MCP1693651.1 glycosyltransferase involved in cell wall biosynthesis [Citrobacter farmeri]